MGHPSITGSIIGAVAGSAFVWVNRIRFPEPWATATLAAWVAAFGFYLWTVFLARRAEPEAPDPRRRALGVYLASVVGMVALIGLGAWALREAARSELQVSLVVIAVGLHFLPFAWAFAAPVFRILGWLLAVLGGLGLVLGWVLEPLIAQAASVLAGLAMIVIISVDALRPVGARRP